MSDLDDEVAQLLDEAVVERVIGFGYCMDSDVIVTECGAFEGLAVSWLDAADGG